MFTITETERTTELNQTIQDIYGDLSPDEVDILASDFDDSCTITGEVVEVRSRYVIVRAWQDNVGTVAVRFPEELMDLLAFDDTFLMTIGRQGSVWFVLWMSDLHTKVMTDDVH